jgi:CheY-like chemotaxis protein
MAAHTLKIGPPDPARLLRTSDIIDRQVAHMTRLLDDLLDVSRVTGGMVTLSQERCDMREVVGEALEQSHSLLVARQHRLAQMLPPYPAVVVGDRTRLVQIVTNLVQNAAKYTPPGGEIDLALDLQDDCVVLTVRDNGVGIDVQLLPHIFELFIQGKRSADRAQGGLGLGLALVKSLAERHGGSVSAHSDGEGLGSRFELKLPSAPTDTAIDERSEAKDWVSGRSLSILIVDDNEDAASMLALYFQTLGHRVVTAFNGADALALATRASPDVFVLDIGLPDMDGYALAAELRQRKQSSASVIVALTGYGLPEDRARARAAGFDHHLTKPVTPALLAALLGPVQAGLAQTAGPGPG